MKKEIPFENQNPLVVRMRGVRAHTISPNGVKSQARLLVDEAIIWGGGSGDKKADDIKMEKDLAQAAARHNTEHGHLNKAVAQLQEAQGGSDLAFTNPLLTPEIVTNRLKELDEKAWQAYQRVSDSNIALRPYRLYQIHEVPSDIKIRPQQEDQGQR